jgi:hypothetical protein
MIHTLDIINSSKLIFYQNTVYLSIIYIVMNSLLLQINIINK